MLAAAVALPAQAERLRGLVPSTVTSSDGLSIAVVESGETTGRPILFVHGFSQSAAAWRRQMLSDLGDSYRLIAFDLRGHGYSSKPADPKHYIASKLWADDIAAVIAAKGLKDVVLVGWSYGGLPLLDYVKAHGQGKLSAMVFVATGYNLDLRPPDQGGPEMVLGPGVIENTGPMAGIPRRSARRRSRRLRQGQDLRGLRTPARWHEALSRTWFRASHCPRPWRRKRWPTTCRRRPMSGAPW